MKLLLTLSLATTLFLQANDNPYQLPITRDGVTHTMLAYNFWSGEYPSPVIYLQPDTNKQRQIRGYTTLRNPNQQKVCTVKSGIYHPWSHDKTSLIHYYSIVPNICYRVQNDTLFENHQLKRGDELQKEIYLSEGYCSYLLNGKTAIESTCIDQQDTHFKRMESPSHPSEQWLHLACHEGYTVFVQDSDLLTQPHVSEGTIVGYGEVSK